MASTLPAWYDPRRLLPWRSTQTSPDMRAAPGNDPNAVMINMGDVLEQPLANATGVKAKKHETLFGPSLGTVNSGPAWATQPKPSHGAAVDELTPEAVKAWVAKSKEPSQPTTTLQALVNLKRPSLRLSPLSLDLPVSAEVPSESAAAPPPAQHGLEFEFDADTPRCQISLHVISPGSTNPPMPSTSTLIFQSIVDGGFGRALKLDDGAVLDLVKLEHDHGQDSYKFKSTASLVGEKGGSGPNTPTDTSSAIFSPVSPRSKKRVSATSSLAPPSEPDVSSRPSTATSAQPHFLFTDPSRPSTGTSAVQRTKKRFSALKFRKRAIGPALQVVDEQAPTFSPGAADGADPTGDAPASSAAGVKPDTNTEEDGVRLSIRLEALDEHDNVLVAPNSQVTYLHIVRMGHVVAGEEDTRPWVVKVVKREATIGLHTFHLHEIYGLSSTAAPASQPTTYPPNSAPADEVAQAAYDFAGTECVLCLSEPREVVLLPCRHLVACKDCALNMIEFGAGGTLTHTEDATAATDGPTAEGGPDGGAGGETTNDGPAPVTPITPIQPRRKRKAKGWFCPVCRQPYTSLLRITTTPPNLKKDVEDAETESGGVKQEEMPAPVLETTITSTSPPITTPGWTKPSFLRTFSSKTPKSETVATTASPGASVTSPAPSGAGATSSEPSPTPTQVSA